MKVRTTEAAQLRIQIGHQSTLQERIFRKIDARHNVTWTESDLLRLREKVVWVSIEHHFPDDLHGHVFLGDDLGCVEHVELETIRNLLIENL